MYSTRSMTLHVVTVTCVVSRASLTLKYRYSCMHRLGLCMQISRAIARRVGRFTETALAVWGAPRFSFHVLILLSALMIAVLST